MNSDTYLSNADLNTYKLISSLVGLAIGRFYGKVSNYMKTAIYKQFVHTIRLYIMVYIGYELFT